MNKNESNNLEVSHIILKAIYYNFKKNFINEEEEIEKNRIFKDNKIIEEVLEGTIETKKNFKELILERQKLHEYHDKIYENIVEGINSQLLELGDVKGSLEKQFLNACALDISGEVIRTFFDMSDYNITTDQLYQRIINFRYDDEFDPLSKDIELKKELYNLNNSKETLENIIKELEDSRIKIFEKEAGKYKDNKIISKGKENYREELEKRNGLKDELGNASSDKLEVDHIQPLSPAQAYTKYLKGLNEIKKFYNSADNFGMLGKTANGCKGDAKVYQKDKDGNYLKDENGEKIDITYKASPEQVAEAVIDKLEGGKNRKIETTEKLKNDGILDESGKVYPHIKRKIAEDIRKSQNKESIVILKDTDYKKVGEDALYKTRDNIHKILIGQVMYYLTPPLIYEIKINMKKDLTSNEIIENLKDSSDRIINYICSKKTDIMKNFGEKSFKKFLKNIFDILIQMVKATIKKIIKMVRQLVIMSVDAVKIIMDEKRNSMEKMDAILQLISGVVVSIVCEVLFEYIEKQFGLPEPWLMPLQMLTTILASNFIMITLQEMDLFSVKFGYKLENIKNIYKKVRDEYNQEFKDIMINIKDNDKEINLIYQELDILKKNISEIDIFKISLKSEIKRVCEVFEIDLNLDNEWRKFLGVGFY